MVKPIFQKRLSVFSKENFGGKIKKKCVLFSFSGEKYDLNDHDISNNSNNNDSFYYHDYNGNSYGNDDH